MSDFLNKTWTVESDECLEEEMLDDCCTSIQMESQSDSKLNATTRLSTTFSVDNEIDIKNMTTTLAKDTSILSTCSTKDNNNNNNFVKCSLDILSLFEKLEFDCYFSLFDEDLNGIEFESGEPISKKFTKSRVIKSRVSNINNQTINIEETKPKENLNVTVNIQDQMNVTVNKSPKTNATKRVSESNKLNVTIDIEDESAKEPLNVTIEIKENKAVVLNDIETGNLNQPLLANFVQETIPNSLDVFVDDLNKQSLLNSPSSSSSASASSSTSSLNSNKLYNPITSSTTRGVLPTNSKLANYKTNVKILTSSIDKDLHKIAQENKNEKPPRTRISMINPPKSSMPPFKQTVSTQILRNATNNSTPTTNNIAPSVNKNTATITRKKSLKRPSITSPSSINNRTIDIGDENKLVKSNDVLFNDIESGNINTPILNKIPAIPKSFDVFADDINKQSLLNSPTSSSTSASSSTSSLSSNRLYNPTSTTTRGILPANSKLANYKTSVKILTSSIDNDLHKIAQPNSAPKQELAKPKVAPPSRSMIPSLKTGIPVPSSYKSAIPMYKPSTGQVLRNATNNNIAVKK